MAKVAVTFRVNGETQTVEAYPLARLLDVLREELRLTGTKEGCGEGECGACAVLLDGELVNSCLVPIAQASGTAITTIEGIATGDQLHAVQQAFLECGGEQHPQPTLEEIRNGLAGNLCRCTGYMKIFESVVRAYQQG
jgi:aerobic carbon-monoxide dehydrogenase small subunit